MAEREKKYPVRLNLFVSSEMDDMLDDMCDVMQISKNEYIRYCIGASLMGMRKAGEVMREQAREESTDSKEA